MNNTDSSELNEHEEIMALVSQTLSLDTQTSRAASSVPPESMEDEISDSEDSEDDNLPALGGFNQRRPSRYIRESVFGDTVPDLPALHEGARGEATYFQHNHMLVSFPVSDLVCGETDLSEYYESTINLSSKNSTDIFLSARFYSKETSVFSHTNASWSDEKYMFILVDKYHDVLETRIFSSKKVRFVLVLDHTQYNKLKNDQSNYELLKHMDLLVIDSVNSNIHGNFDLYCDENSVKRNSVFILAHQYKLQKFIVATSTIKEIKYLDNYQNNSFKHFFNLLKKNMGKKSSFIAMVGNYHKEVRDKMFGICLFMINMEVISNRLKHSEDMFYLMPQAKDANNWAEVLYFQYFLRNLGKNEPNVLKRKKAVILFKTTKDNLIQNLSDPMALPDVFENESFLKQCIAKTVEKVNEIISENIKYLEAKKMAVLETDLFSLQAKRQNLDECTQTATAATFSNARAAHDEFNTHIVNRLDMLIDSTSNGSTSAITLKNFQVKALKKIKEYISSGKKFGYLELAVGCGKTLMAYLLMREAWLSLNNKEYIVFVTSQKHLVDQMYFYFKRCHHIFNDKEIFDFRQVLCISSKPEHISLDLYQYNEPVKEKKRVLIFCDKSFSNFLGTFSEASQRELVKLVWVDEAHVTEKLLTEIRNAYKEEDTLIIASTATPSSNTNRDEIIYSYPMWQAIADRHLPPVVIDSLSVKYSPGALNNLIGYLPFLLNHCCHPGYSSKLLKDLHGIVFLPSIPSCDQALKVAQARGINAIAIHSQSKQQYKQQSQPPNYSTEGSVTFAVRSARHGLNWPWLDYVILGQNLTEGHAPTATQMIGRVTRLTEDRKETEDREKVAYVISFENIVSQVIPKELTQSVLTVRPDPSYLEQAPLQLYWDESEQTWCATRQAEDMSPISADTQVTFKVGNIDDRLSACVSDDECGMGNGYNDGEDEASGELESWSSSSSMDDQSGMDEAYNDSEDEASSEYDSQAELWSSSSMDDQSDGDEAYNDNGNEASRGTEPWQRSSSMNDGHDATSRSPLRLVYELTDSDSDDSDSEIQPESPGNSPSLFPACNSDQTVTSWPTMFSLREKRSRVAAELPLLQAREEAQRSRTHDANQHLTYPDDLSSEDGLSIGTVATQVAEILPSFRG